MLDRVLELEDASLGLSFVTGDNRISKSGHLKVYESLPDIGFLLTHPYHDALMTGAAHDAREHSSRGIIT
jgi:hypothetical protein